MSRILQRFIFSRSCKSQTNYLFTSSFKPSAKVSDNVSSSPQQIDVNIEQLPFGPVDLHQIRKDFRALKGGQVVLTKDETRGIAYVCLDHVEKKNGVSGSMMVDLNEIITTLETWDSGKALVLHGKGDLFCSGGFLPTVKKICNHQDGFKMCSLMQDSAIRLSKLPLISVSVVHGQAIGGGAELMLSTDFRLFTPSANCRFVEARMGVGTGWAGGTLLRRLVGPTTALKLLLSCRKVTAEEAISIGLADGLVSEDNSLEDAVKWLEELYGGIEFSVARTVKKIVACDNLEEEKRIFATSWGGAPQLRVLNSTSNLKHNL